MRNVDLDIGDILNKTLEKDSTRLTFGTLWNTYSKKGRGAYRIKKSSLVPIVAIVSLLIFCTIGYANITRQTDNIDLPFVDDPTVIGNWEAVDFVSEIKDFNPEEKAYEGELYLNNLIFIKSGNMLDRYENSGLFHSDSFWTKGTIINAKEKIASSYEIKEIDGKRFMFFEWKNEDYFLRFMKPKYYVLMQIDALDYSEHGFTIIEDKIDYPFENNPDMLGLWKAVDYIREIDEFDPEKLKYQNTLYLEKLEILENGKLISKYSDGIMLTSEIKWTGDLIIHPDKKTASKCTIKKIDGRTYMFYEWKSGDYTHRGMKPHYYVLEKLQ